MFRDRISPRPDRPAYLHAVVSPTGDEWVTVTWAELDVVVREIGAGLVALGIAARGPGRHRLEHPLRVGPGRPRRDVRRRRDDDDLPDDDGRRRRLHPVRLRQPRSSSPRTPSSSRSCAASAPRSPAVLRVIVFDGVADADGWVITLDELAPARPRVPRGRPRRVDARIDGIRRRPARHAHLHLGHDRPPQGRAAAARRVDLRGRRRRGDRHPHRGRPAVPLAAAGARLRQGAAHPAAADRLPHRHRRPDRQDRREPGRRQADLHGRGRRASSRRPTAASR